MSTAVLLDRLIVEEIMYKEGELRLCKERIAQCDRLTKYLEGILEQVRSTTTKEEPPQESPSPPITHIPQTRARRIPSESPKEADELPPPPKRRRARATAATSAPEPATTTDTGPVSREDKVGFVASLQWGALSESERVERQSEAQAHLASRGLDPSNMGSNRRLYLWDHVASRIIAGTGAPKMKDAVRFLARHPFISVISSTSSSRSDEEIAAAPPPIRFHGIQLALNSSSSKFYVLAAKRRGLTEAEEDHIVRQYTTWMNNTTDYYLSTQQQQQ